MKISRLQVYNIPKVDLALVSQQIPGIEGNHLSEKLNWYQMNGQLIYFKQRDDYRFFAELFNSKLFKFIGLNPVDYFPGIIDGKSGVLSVNFQDNPNLIYQDIDSLHEDCYHIKKGYKGYSLKSVLNFMKEKLEPQNYEQMKNILIQLYIADYYTHQLDRNPKNLIIETDKETNYTEVSKIFDNEKALGINNGGQFSDELDIWAPSMPYENNLENGLLDGIESHIFGLFIDYPEETLRYIENTLSYDPEHLISEYIRKDSPIRLKQPSADHLKYFFEHKRKKLERIKTL